MTQRPAAPHGRGHKRCRRAPGAERGLGRGGRRFPKASSHSLTRTTPWRQACPTSCAALCPCWTSGAPPPVEPALLGQKPPRTGWEREGAAETPCCARRRRHERAPLSQIPSTRHPTRLGGPGDALQASARGLQRRVEALRARGVCRCAYDCGEQRHFRGVSGQTERPRALNRHVRHRDASGHVPGAAGAGLRVQAGRVRRNPAHQAFTGARKGTARARPAPRPRPARADAAGAAGFGARAEAALSAARRAGACRR
jgi:hypothetical protein